MRSLLNDNCDKNLIVFRLKGMTKINISFLILLATSVHGMHELLYPYGPIAGDTWLSNVDDESSPELLLAVAFPYFDKLFHSLFINTNGVISFISPVLQYTPERFPLQDKFCVIAPYWADVDTTRSTFGGVFYRQSQDADLLDQITKEILDNFVNQQRFRSTWALIVTWENVTFYGGSPNTPTNTFQAVLLTNGRHSFAIFNYEKITWTTGNNNRSGGNENGLGGIPAHAGFNAGDGIRYFTIPGSLSSSVINIGNTSNVGKPGRWIFRIDDKEIESNGCNTGGSVTLYPNSGSMLGGMKVLISGPCFKYTDNIMCKFDNISSRGYYLNANRIMCYTPLLKITGRIKFQLSVDDGNYYPYTGLFESVSPLKCNSSLSRDFPNSWSNNFGPYTIRWQPEKILTDCVILELLGFWQDTTQMKQIIIPVAHNLQNAGIYQFKPVIALKNPLVLVGALRLISCQESNNRDQTVLWSDLHDLEWYRLQYLKYLSFDIAKNHNKSFSSSLPSSKYFNKYIKYYLKYYISPILHRFKNKIISILENVDNTELNNFISSLVEDSWTVFKKSFYNDVCNAWTIFDNMTSYKLLNDVLPPCPCNLRQALQDSGTFVSDDACNKDTTPKCEFHLGAIHCIRSILPSLQGAGQQCCYDFQGRLLNVNDNPSGGTLDRAHGSGYRNIVHSRLIEKIPVVSHYLEDVFPFQVCCKFSDNCQKYFELRPSDDCAAYEPPRVAAGFGDPHITTLDGFEYTFNGIGEFVLTRVDNEVEMQGRASQAKAINGSLVQASVWSAIAIKIKNILSVQVEINGRQELDVYLNDGLVNFESLKTHQFSDISLHLEANDLKISFKCGIFIEISSIEYTLNFIFLLPAIYKDKTKGLLGNWNEDPTDDLLQPDGQILLNISNVKDVHQFGLKWRTTSEESIFIYHYGTNHSYYQNTDFEPNYLRSSDFSDSAIEALCDKNPQCVYDYYMMGNIAIANFSKNAAEEIKKVREDTQKVVSCGFPSIPKHSIKYGIEYFSGKSVTFKCKEGYKEISTQVNVTCQANGTWTTNDIVCIEINCSTPEPLHDGQLFFKSLFVGSYLYYKCNESFYLKGDAIRTCLPSGFWSGKNPVCIPHEITISMGFLAGVLGGIGAAIILIAFISFCYRLKFNEPKPQPLQDIQPLMKIKKHMEVINNQLYKNI